MTKYEMIIYWSEEDQAYIAEVPELPGCMADGKSYQEAANNAEVAIDDWVAVARKLGRNVPKPKERQVKPDENMLERYREIVREKRWQETELTNHRISWMVTFHSLLITAISFVWEKGNDSKPVLIGFIFAGIFVSISSWFSLYIGKKAAEKIREEWKRIKSRSVYEPELIGYDAMDAWENKKSWKKSLCIWLILPWHSWPFMSLIGWFTLLCYIFHLPQKA